MNLKEISSAKSASKTFLSPSFILLRSSLCSYSQLSGTYAFGGTKASVTFPDLSTVSRTALMLAVAEYEELFLLADVLMPYLKRNASIL